MQTATKFRLIPATSAIIEPEESSSTISSEDESIQPRFVDALESFEIPKGDILPSYHMYESLINCSLEILSIPPDYSQSQDVDSLFNYEDCLVMNIRGPLKKRLNELKNTRDISVLICLDELWWDHVFHPGDEVSGTVMLTNKSAIQVSLSQVYIILDGCFKDASTEVSFLEMIDFENLVSEPIVMEGNATKKIRFSFKIPEHHMVDDVENGCNLQLPPSISTKKLGIQYKLSCFVTRQEEGRKTKLGQDHVVLTVLTQYPVVTIENTEYNNELLSCLFLDLQYERVFLKKVANSVLLTDLKSSFSYCKRDVFWTLYLGDKDNGFKGVRADCVQSIFPKPLVQTLRIPFDLEPHDYELITVSAELVVVDIISPLCEFPMELPPTMFFESHTGRRFHEIVEKPLRAMVTYLRNQGVSPYPLCDILQLDVRYQKFHCPIVFIDKNEIGISLDGMYALKRMYKKDTKIDCNKFVPNFQYVCIGREYFLSLTAEVGKGKKKMGKVSMNVPVFFTA